MIDFECGGIVLKQVTLIRPRSAATEPYWRGLQSLDHRRAQFD
ncbi:hypothetical protein [Streptomyces flaveolus]